MPRDKHVFGLFFPPLFPPSICVSFRASVHAAVNRPAIFLPSRLRLHVRARGRGREARNSFSTCRGLSGFCVTRSYSWAVFIMNMQLLFYYIEGGSPFSQVGAGLSVRNAVKIYLKCPFLVLRAIHYWEKSSLPPFLPMCDTACNQAE